MDRSDRSDEPDRSVLHIRLITPLRLITLDSHPAEACFFASVWFKIKLRIASILSDANLTKISYTAKPSPKNQKKAAESGLSHETVMWLLFELVLFLHFLLFFFLVLFLVDGELVVVDHSSRQQVEQQERGNAEP